jgi:hypothetical protein
MRASYPLLLALLALALAACAPAAPPPPPPPPEVKAPTDTPPALVVAPTPIASGSPPQAIVSTATSLPPTITVGPTATPTRIPVTRGTAPIFPTPTPPLPNVLPATATSTAQTSVEAVAFKADRLALLDRVIPPLSAVVLMCPNMGGLACSMQYMKAKDAYDAASLDILRGISRPPSQCSGLNSEFTTAWGGASRILSMPIPNTPQGGFPDTRVIIERANNARALLANVRLLIIAPNNPCS